MKYIIHQVNCMGAFGAGFAGYLNDVSMTIRDDYIRYVHSMDDTRKLLGTYHITPYSDDVAIVHLFSQYGYGRGSVHTDYIAMDKGLKSFRKKYPKADCICPYLIGCGLAGGDWDIVKKILKRYDVVPSDSIRINEDGELSYSIKK